MSNKELQLAWEFVNHTKRHLFLTGKAGTGKTTFLLRLKVESPKRLAVVAPTGVAAINARGVTIHSFFQVPFGPFIPDASQRPVQRDFKQKFSKKKIDIIKSLDLLIIDEISMVRADLLDAIDYTLRRYKKRDQVFGGVQVVMIGDLQQLAPVIKPDEWQLLKKYYKTPYFFSSKAFQEANAVSIELKNIYRQEDEKFINILNEIRNNTLSETSAKLLNERYILGFVPKEDQDYILLTTHNRIADKINREKLEAIDEKTYYFHAYTEGHFPENAYPNDKKLALKKGAQVMFIKNDSSFEKRYYNGKIGKITAIDDKEIFVKSPGDEQEIKVTRETWDNITYEIDPQTQKIVEKNQGSYSQIPLRLSWAITIHKSQGLTFERAIIDAEQAFAHGQTYVALSRCKTLEGLVLTSPINSKSIINDQRITGFTKEIAEKLPDTKELTVSKKQFFLDNILELFDYLPLLFPVNRLLDLYQKNTTSVQGEVYNPLIILKENFSELINIQKKFLQQLNQLSKDIAEPEQNNIIQDRISKALSYFYNQTENHIKKQLDNLQFDIDNKQVKKDFVRWYDELDNRFNEKLFIYNQLGEKFDTETYLDIRAKAVLNQTKPKKKKNLIPKNIKHIDLLEALKDLRSQFAYEEDVHHFQIFTQQTLYELCERLPVTPAQLKKVPGIGKVRLKKYGESILNLIKDFCIVNDIPLKEDEIIKPNPNTKKISLDLFLSGKNPEEIAGERGLTLNTIMTHLIHFIPIGEIKIQDLIPQERYDIIKQIIENNSFESLSDLKQIVGDEFDWWELRLVLKVNQS